MTCPIAYFKLNLDPPVQQKTLKTPYRKGNSTESETVCLCSEECEDVYYKVPVEMSDGRVSPQPYSDPITSANQNQSAKKYSKTQRVHKSSTKLGPRHQVLQHNDPVPYAILITTPDATPQLGNSYRHNDNELLQDHHSPEKSTIKKSSSDNSTCPQGKIGQIESSADMIITGKSNPNKEITPSEKVTREGDLIDSEKYSYIQHPMVSKSEIPQDYACPVSVGSSKKTSTPQEYLIPISVGSREEKSPQEYLTPISVGSRKTERPQEYLTPVSVGSRKTEQPQEYLAPISVGSRKTECPQEYLTPMPAVISMNHPVNPIDASAISGGTGEKPPQCYLLPVPAKRSRIESSTNNQH